MNNLLLAAFAALALTACAQVFDAPVKTVAEAPCIVGGCSSQLCLNNTEANRNAVSTCEFRPAYACYSSVGTCEKQASGPNAGQCGWTPTRKLQNCLDKANANS